MSDDLANALKKLDPGDRALLELSLQRGIPDDDLARVLGTNASDIDQRRRKALANLAHELQADEDALAAKIRDLPAEQVRAADDEQTKVEDASAALHGGEAKSERKEEAKAGFLRSNSLSIFFLAIFLPRWPARRSPATRVQRRPVAPPRRRDPLGRYLTTSQFAAVTENWQSEYLQFTLYIFATVWLLQRGSPESKRAATGGPRVRRGPAGRATRRGDSPRWARAGGWRTRCTPTRCSS